MLTHSYGWKPDLPDHRDFIYAKISKPSIEKRPPSVDLRPNCSPIEDQGNLGSCTANALVGNLEFLEIKDSVQFSNLSRLFVYYNERIIENTVNYDSGAEIRDGIKTLNKQGVCKENQWPYNIFRFKTKPTAKCYTDAATHKIVEYARLNIIDEMKTCLATGYPFVFGFSVYESFETEEAATTGIIPMPSKDEQLLGGHAVMACGYNDTVQRFIIRNSW